MEVLSGILALVFLALLVMFVIGLIAPGKVFLGKDCTRGKAAVVYGVGCLAALCLFGFVTPDTKNSGVLASSASGTSGALTAAPNAAPTPAPEEKTVQMPDSEANFVTIVAEGQQNAKDAKNDMQRGGVKAARDKKLCKAIGSRKVTDWVGQVTKVGANSDGKGILEVELAKGIIIKTWNNSLSDMGDHTLIEPGSAVFNTASNFSEGQIIKFSGTFLRGIENECVRESSLSLQGTLDELEFIFRFSSVSPL